MRERGAEDSDRKGSRPPTLLDNLRAANAELVTVTINAQEAQERSDRRIEGLDAIIWQADAQTGQFTFVSQRAEKMLGYPCERWLEANFWTHMIHPDDRDRVIRASQEAVAARRDYQLQYRATASDGHVVWLAHIARMSETASYPAVVLGVMVEITEQKHMEDLLREVLNGYRTSEANLQEKLRELERFEEAVVGRELKMIALEKEVEGLKKELAALKG
jgi:PAS domain S-box-containing protein